MQSAHIVLTNEQAGDFLAIGGTQVHNGDTGTIGAIGYTVTDTGSQITIDLSGSDTKANYQAAIDAITFASSSENPSEVDRTITATVTDDHGNVSNVATTTVHVSAVDDAPVAPDLQVRSNWGNNAFTVPDWAFLSFATDLDSTALTFTGVSGILGLSASWSGTTHLVTIDDSNPAGGQFDYTISDGTLSGSGTATYVQDSGTVNGTSSGEIIVGDNSGVTINGNGGNDVIFGGTGDDIITTGTGNDIIVGGAGRDTIDSGTGHDIIIENAVVGSSSNSARFHNFGNGDDVGQDTIIHFDMTNDTLRIVATNVSNFTHGTDTTTGAPGSSDSGNAASFTESDRAGGSQPQRKLRRCG